MDPKLADKLMKIRQGNNTWQCTLRRAPIWITPKNLPPYRPFIIMVVDQDSEMIIKTEMLDIRPTPQAFLTYLLNTMQGSLLSLLKKIRPARISIDDAELVQACTPQMAEVGVRVELRATLPQVNTALHEMEVALNKQESNPGLMSVMGVSVPLLAELYASSAEFFRQAPWHFFTNSEVIEVRYPADSEQVRYALVLGSGGEFFGLSLYQSLDDLDVIFSTNEDQPHSRPITWISMIFEEERVVSYEDLDAIERFGWHVAGKKAYPMVFKATTGIEEGEVPSAIEITWMAAAIRAIPTFLIQNLRADRGLPKPAQVTLALPGVHGNQQIALCYPAASLNPQQEDPLLEAFIKDWYWDEATHNYARQMGAFLFEFLDDLDFYGLTEKTIFKHEGNCWSIGMLETRFGKHATFTPDVFLGGPKFIEEYKLKISDSKSSISSYQTTWRKLEKYIISLDE